MDEMHDFAHKMKLLDFTMGIGETCRVTGVTTAQIRYWEKKGFIQSFRHGDRQNKRYSYANIATIVFIKTRMDAGYTLTHAAADAQRHFDDVQVLRRLLFHGSLHVEHLKDGPRVMLGQLANEPGSDVVAKVGDDITLMKVPHVAQ